MTKITQFPTEEYIDKLSVDKLMAELNEYHKNGEIQNMVVVRFDNKGDVFLGETGGLTLAQFSYAIAVLSNYLQKWMNA